MYKIKTFYTLVIGNAQQNVVLYLLLSSRLNIYQKDNSITQKKTLKLFKYFSEVLLKKKTTRIFIYFI